MESQALEQLLENTFVPKIGQDRMYQTIDTYTIGTTVLYSSGKPLDKPIIYDMPSVGGQVHLHENELGITGGRLYPYDRSTFKPINAYEGAMLDLYAKKLGIDRK
ncbi:MAG: hypothetical protein PWR30_377 [Candidatus Woesearchaeota archaeon]|nr:hypothetical protein [Candidatus Woesearchaeota archaeon]